MRKLLLVLMLVATNQLFAQQRIEKSFDGITKIDITVSSGDASFKKGDSKQVSMVLEHTIDDYNPEIEKRGSRLIIKEERRNGSWSSRGSASWEFEIPDGIDIEFQTGSGTLSIEDLEADVRSNSGSGDMLFSNSNIDAKVNTGVGPKRPTPMK